MRNFNRSQEAVKRAHLEEGCWGLLEQLNCYLSHYKELHAGFVVEMNILGMKEM